MDLHSRIRSEEFSGLPKGGNPGALVLEDGAGGIDPSRVGQVDLDDSDCQRRPPIPARTGRFRITEPHRQTAILTVGFARRGGNLNVGRMKPANLIVKDGGLHPPYKTVGFVRRGVVGV